MGRQINYVHVEEDIPAFLYALEKNGGRIVINGKAVCPTSCKEKIINDVKKHHAQYFLFHSDYTQEDGSLSCNLSAESKIEFNSCCKGNSASRTYEVGRLYIMAMPTGEYDLKTLTLYNQMRKHIKKNYLYDSQERIYCSQTFKKLYEKNYYYAVNTGYPIHFHFQPTIVQQTLEEQNDILCLPQVDKSDKFKRL